MKCAAAFILTALLGGVLPAMAAPQEDPPPADASLASGDPLIVQGEDSIGEELEETDETDVDEAGDPTAAPEGEPAAPRATAPARPADQALGELFVRANDAYEESRYPRAIDLYGQLLEDGADHGALHYNLGNAYLRAGELGRAIASYRRSLVRQPRDQDAAANLDFARRSARDALAPPAPSEVQRTLLFWHYGLSTKELLATAVVLNLLFWGCLALHLFRRRWEILRWLAALALVPLLAVTASLAVKTLAPQRVAVVVPQEVDVRSSPDGGAVVRFKLHAGTEVRLVEQRGDWLRLELPDGQQGWLEVEHTEQVTS
ncbi:MAG: tetratricopeptide repeat protein [Acidobacteriota bacterium]